jgi:phage shock protein PspC (stress-responsive transcriptional regulator)
MMSHNDVISCFVATIGVLYAVDDQRVHFVMTAVLGATIGMVVYLILALDHPLWGEVSVAPTAFEVVAESMDRSLNPMTSGERRVSSNGGFAP